MALEMLLMLVVLLARFKSKKRLDYQRSYRGQRLIVQCLFGGVSGNEIRLNPKPGKCMLIGPDTFVYDLQLSSGDMTRTYLKGELPIDGDITNT
jgi:hypothetical protein